jgi:kynurenine formamidase
VAFPSQQLVRLRNPWPLREIVLSDIEKFTHEDAVRLMYEDRNWGRWGAKDEKGLVNLIDDEKRRRAATLVRRGQPFSLSRPFPKVVEEGNLRPAQHYMRQTILDGGGSAADFYGIDYHGVTATHLDGLSHVWGADGMWNGRRPEEVLSFDGARGGGIDNWRDGILTRGVLLDVPRYRGVEHVTQDAPVHGDELARMCSDFGIEIEPGDAVVISCGREAYERHFGVWGTDGASLRSGRSPGERPGLHVSCLGFLRRIDCAVLVWDMMDLAPYPFGLTWSVHAAIFAHGLALIDNAALEQLCRVCASVECWEFLFTVAPLRVDGGTGSPVNPIAVLLRPPQPRPHHATGHGPSATAVSHRWARHRRSLAWGDNS